MARSPWNRLLLLVLLGVAALGLGLLVYRVDRVAHQHWFGPLADWLPSFVHVLAFGLLSAAVLAPTAPARAGACLCWAGVNIVFELGQHPAFKPRWAAALQGQADEGTIGRAVLNYLLRGTFDPLDIAAALLGAAVAWLVLQRVDAPTEVSHAKLA